VVLKEEVLKVQDVKKEVLVTEAKTIHRLKEVPVETITTKEVHSPSLCP
jgi:hypothetical protein